MKWGLVGGLVGIILAVLVVASNSAVLWIYGFIIVVLVGFNLILSSFRQETMTVHDETEETND